MKANLYLAPLISASLAFMFSCSPAAKPLPDDNVTEFCNDWATAFCKISATCQFDPSTCETYQVQVCNAFATSSKASGARQYSQPAGLDCINAINSAFGVQPPPSAISDATYQSLMNTCNMAFAGNTASGSACTSNFDCVDGQVCALIPSTNSASTKSVCATPTQKAGGDGCADPGDECSGDFYCDPGADAGFPECVPTPPSGGACSAAFPCGPEDHCVSGSCLPRSGIGDTCATNADCSSAAPMCNPYPPYVCITELTFALQSSDCLGILGQTSPGGAVGEDAGASGADGGNASSASDAASGG